MHIIRKKKKISPVHRGESDPVTWEITQRYMYRFGNPKIAKFSVIKKFSQVVLLFMMPKRRNIDVDSKDNGKVTRSNDLQQYTEQDISIPYKEKYITGLLTLPSTHLPSSGIIVILTHGAGGDMHTHQLKYLSKNLAISGSPVLRFTCKGLNVVYRSNVYLSVLRHVHSIRKKYGFKKCVLGGRSMGSRAAVNVANEIQNDSKLSDFTAGVCSLAYPLHPPKHHNKLRDEPLLKLITPILFLSGTEDEMADRDLFKAVLRNMSGKPTVRWLDGVKHSHTTTKDNQEELDMNISQTVIDWLSQLK